MLERHLQFWQRFLSVSHWCLTLCCKALFSVMFFHWNWFCVCSSALALHWSGYAQQCQVIMTHFLVLICFLHGKHGKHCWDNLLSPSKRESRSSFYQCFSAFPTKVEKSFERRESPSLCLCEAKVAAVALLFYSSAWALELIIFFPVTLIWVCQCLSIPLSKWRGLSEHWSLVLWPAAKSLGQAFCCSGIGFWGAASPPSPELYAETMQENAGFSLSMLCLSLAAPTEMLVHKLWKGK